MWGQSEEAARECRKVLDVDGNYLLGLYFIGGAYSRLGRHDEASVCLRELEQRSASEHVGSLYRSIITASLGEMDRAFEILDEATRERNCWVGIPGMAIFDDLRRDPRFNQHLNRDPPSGVGSPHVRSTSTGAGTGSGLTQGLRLTQVRPSAATT